MSFDWLSLFLESIKHNITGHTGSTNMRSTAYFKHRPMCTATEEQQFFCQTVLFLCGCWRAQTCYNTACNDTDGNHPRYLQHCSTIQDKRSVLWFSNFSFMEEFSNVGKQPLKVILKAPVTCNDQYWYFSIIAIANHWLLTKVL